MKIHYLQHVPFEDSANIGKWAQENGHSLSKTEIYEDEPFPNPSEIDMLAVMGGLMNIYQHRDYPWLKNEKVFIKEAIDKGIKVIGICLGGQLIADVLGGKVTQNPYVEIGWHDVTLTEEGMNSNILNGFPETFRAFHWHGDTFELPPGAKYLASSKACKNQAFQYKENVIGLQFHMEYSQESIEKMLVNCADELIDAPYIQNMEQIRQDYSLVENNTELLNKLLQNFL